MKNKLLAAVGAAVTGACVTAAQAAPFTALDARALGMAGTGVAAGAPHQAALYNPALLAAHPDQRFGLMLPSIGVRAADPQDLFDELDDFQDRELVERLEAAVAAAEANPSPTTAEAVQDAARDLKAGLERLHGRALVADAQAGLGIAVPSQSLGVAVSGHGWASGGGLLSISEADLALMDQYIDYDGSGAPPPFEGDRDLQSQVLLRGAVIAELGVSLARAFSVGGRTIALGITPKYQNVRTLDYGFQVQDEDAEISLSEGERQYSNFNADLGIATELGGGFLAGAVVKNVISQRYATVEGNEVTLKPQVRVGLAHRSKWTTLAVDMDLTENDPLGYDERTRYLALGAELNLWNTVQLRGGYRRNLVSTDISAGDIYAVGLGFSPFGVHLDLGVAGNDSDVAAALNLGLRF
ncbi:conjugal transfer protein TraF [Ectothiorhodospiraceae bacterium 2226]|nr:conjugal transfer protein TraF [Ectothiorhodospiraceae bacterium 2226]